ncbi:MAG: hypothetical protein ACK5MR_18610 [Cumulibacter sp.]
MNINDAASLIYENKKPILQSPTEINKNNKLIFATIGDSIYTGKMDNNGVPSEIQVEKGVDIYVIESTSPQYDENGIFQYTNIEFKKIIPYVAKRGAVLEESSGSSGQNNDIVQYIVLNFYKIEIQPKN